MVCELNYFNHPGGESLIEQTVGSDITKYMYGVSSLEGNYTKPFRHSPYAISLLEKNSIGEYINNQIIQKDSTNWRIISTQ